MLMFLCLYSEFRREENAWNGEVGREHPPLPVVVLDATSFSACPHSHVCSPDNLPDVVFSFR
jgi:hypothetical protein